jgi:3-hydroxyacyl-[acyl-carrier-protein] dehydratase
VACDDAQLGAGGGSQVEAVSGAGLGELGFERIKVLLPHRYPFLLIDHVKDHLPGKWAKAVKCVSGNELFFQGHFPAQAVMPGVLIVEALAQCGAIALLSENGMEGRVVYFAGIREARFKAQVCPGTQLDLECLLTRRRGNYGIGKGVASVSGKVACTAEISFMISEDAGVI